MGCERANSVFQRGSSSILPESEIAKCSYITILFFKIEENTPKNQPKKLKLVALRNREEGWGTAICLILFVEVFTF